MKLSDVRQGLGQWTARYAMFITGLYVLTLGVVLIIRSSLGTSPISSFSYVLSLNSPLSLGAATFLLNMVLIAGQFYFIRGEFGSRRDRIEILMQIPFSVLFSLFLDLNMYLLADVTPSGYAAALTMLAIGCVIQAMGVVLELRPDVVAMSAEGFVKYASRRYDKNFGRLKVVLDCSLVALAVATSLLLSHTVAGVREGTVIAAVSVGLLVNLINVRIVNALIAGKRR